LNDFFAQDDSEWLNLFQLDVMSGVRTARHYVPEMAKRGLGARRLYQQRVGAKHPERNDRLWRDQNRNACGVAGAR
jgi:hypothetical protein